MAELREDQKQIAERIIELLKGDNVAALQAPTGWGKSYVASAVIKELGGRWAWTSSLISAMLSAARALHEFGVRYFVSAGKEKLCVMNYGYADFVLRNPCNHCNYNVMPPRDIVNTLISVTDYSKVKEIVEERNVCPYIAQESTIKVALSKFSNSVILMHYKRLGKYARMIDGVVMDEAHNIATPRLVTLSRRAVELLLERFGVSVNTINASAEVIRDILMERLYDIATMADEINGLSLDEIVDFIQSTIVYYDHSGDEYVGLQTVGLELPQGQQKRILYMSATLPPSMITSRIPVVIVPPPRRMTVKIPKWSKVMSVQNIERYKEELIKKLMELLSDGTPSLIFTTSSKGISLDNVVYEDEIRQDDICKRNLMLWYFGRFSEGTRLNCYRRIILLTIPILPMDIMKRLRMRGISEIDIVAIKTIQSIGRIMPQQEPEIVMLDSRFRKYCDVLSQYGIQCVDAG